MFTIAHYTRGHTADVNSFYELFLGPLSQKNLLDLGNAIEEANANSAVRKIKFPLKDPDKRHGKRQRQCTF